MVGSNLLELGVQVSHKLRVEALQAIFVGLDNFEHLVVIRLCLVGWATWGLTRAPVQHNGAEMPEGGWGLIMHPVPSYSVVALERVEALPHTPRYSGTRVRLVLNECKPSRQGEDGLESCWARNGIFGPPLGADWHT